MRRMSVIPLALAIALSASACLTEKTKCPAGHKRTRGLCVELDQDDDAGDAARNSDKDAGEGGAPATLTVCYLDFDHDGAGAGEEVDCESPYADLADASTPDAGEIDASAPDASAPDASSADASSADAAVVPEPGPVLPAVSDRNDDCDDQDANRAPMLKELCDGIDNNCNVEVDDNARNACGGTCKRVLDHSPGEACDNGQLGACVRIGKWVCQGDTDVVCNAPEATASSELCGDTIDNDCDGVVNEPDAVNAVSWFQDCDGDGYAAGTNGSVLSCVKPANVGACSWTSVAPQPATKTNWDCDDSSAAYQPKASYGYPPSGKSSHDLDCDGVVEKSNIVEVPDPPCSGLFCQVSYPSCDASTTCYCYESAGVACSASNSETAQLTLRVPNFNGVCVEALVEGSRACR